MKLFARLAVIATLALVVLSPAVAQTVSPAPAPTTQNTVTTSGPVSSTTTIETGTIAGQVLTWVAAAFATAVGSVLTVWLIRLMKLAGVQGADLLRDKLQEVIINGLNAAAAAGAKELQGKDPITIKNAIVADAVAYTQDHAAETIKALGLDPNSGAAVEAIKARIETAITDPTVPTPPVLSPSLPAKPASRS